MFLFLESKRITLSDDLSEVTNSVVDALTSESPKSIYRVGRGSWLLPALCKYVPPVIRDYMWPNMLNFISSTPQALKRD